jgi:hypothetical protein
MGGNDEDKDGHLSFVQHRWQMATNHKAHQHYDTSKQGVPAAMQRDPTVLTPSGKGVKKASGPRSVPGWAISAVAIWVNTKQSIFRMLGIVWQKRHAQMIFHFVSSRSATLLSEHDYLLFKRTVFPFVPKLSNGSVVLAILVVVFAIIALLVIWLVLPFIQWVAGGAVSLVTAMANPVSSTINFARTLGFLILTVVITVAFIAGLIVWLIFVSLFILVHMPSVFGWLLTRILALTGNFLQLLKETWRFHSWRFCTFLSCMRAVTGGNLPLDFGRVHLAPWIRDRKLSLLVS